MHFLDWGKKRFAAILSIIWTGRHFFDWVGWNAFPDMSIIHVHLHSLHKRMLTCGMYYHHLSHNSRDGHNCHPCSYVIDARAELKSGIGVKRN